MLHARHRAHRRAARRRASRGAAPRAALGRAERHGAGADQAPRLRRRAGAADRGAGGPRLLGGADRADRDAHPARPHQRGDLRLRVGRAPEALPRHGALHAAATATRGRTTRSCSPPTRAAFADAAGRRARSPRADAALAAGRRAGARAGYAGAEPRRIPAGSTRACAWPRSTSRRAASPRPATAASRRWRSAPSTAARTPCWPRRSSRSASPSTCTAPTTSAASPPRRCPRCRASSASSSTGTSLTPRHQKRVALSVAPWKAVRAGAGRRRRRRSTSSRCTCCSRECPDIETLRDQRINYDSRLWDDVRGCGGYHTVTGIEDVERTIFDRYNTVMHELTHQVHGVLPADDVARDPGPVSPRQGARRRDARRVPLALRRRQRLRSTSPRAPTRWSRPKRDAYDPREEVRERLVAMDPDLEALVAGALRAHRRERLSYPVAYAARGDDRVYRGRVDEALPFYEKALALKPDEETRARLVRATRSRSATAAAAAESVATRAMAAHPASGPARLALAEARWHATGAARAARRTLARGAPRGRARRGPLPGRRWRSAATRGRWATPAAGAGGVRLGARLPVGQPGGPARPRLGAGAGRAAPTRRSRSTTRRCASAPASSTCADDFARDLLLAPDAPTAAPPARRGAADRRGEPDRRGAARLGRARARRRRRRARARRAGAGVGRVVRPGAHRRRRPSRGARRHLAAAERAWAPVRARIAAGRAARYVYRAQIASWEQSHTLPAVERTLLKELESR